LVPAIAAIAGGLVTPWIQDRLAITSENRRKKRIVQLEEQLAVVTEHKNNSISLFCYVADWALTGFMGSFLGLCVYLYPHAEHTSYPIVEYQQAIGIGIMSFLFTAFWIPLGMVRKVRFYPVYKEKIEGRIAKLRAASSAQQNTG
jgi:hypothetical protein